MQQSDPAARPNIVLINCDDLGYGDLGCYGSTMHDTPALDRMAREGVRFTDFYMPAAVCSPSRGAMMTGCYPPRIGFGWFDNRWVLLPGHAVGLNPREITFAKLLQQAGYTTKLVGKWHCGDQPPFLPTRHGFDEYFGLPYSNDMGMGVRANDPPTRPPLPLMRNEDVVQEQPDQASLTERYVQESVEFLRANRHRPFFLYLAHMYVHTPLFVPEVFMRQSRNRRYGAAVASIDWAAGALLHELERLGLDKNTLVIFTSDNGSTRLNSNGGLRGWKGTTWEGGLRVPCIMRWPEKIPAGGECRALTTAMDFY
ncbi:MAG: sulfatase-like hydrolase/transferase, partial [Lentisphaerae bacterium]|nr:sulfatase-like hydrolase/transferase [Lentisphaerota bacterium]